MSKDSNPDNNLTLWNIYEWFVSSDDTLLSGIDELPYWINPTSTTYEEMVMARFKLLTFTRCQKTDPQNMRIMVRKLDNGFGLL